MLRGGGHSLPLPHGCSGSPTALAGPRELRGAATQAAPGVTAQPGSTSSLEPPPRLPPSGGAPGLTAVEMPSPPSQGQKEKGMGGACSALAHAPASLTSTMGLILRGAECPHLPMGCPVAISDQHPPAGAQRTLLEARRAKSVDWPTPLCRAAASPKGLRYANEPCSGACAELGSLLPPPFLPGCLCPVWCFPVPVGSQPGLSSAWLWAASAV